MRFRWVSGLLATLSLLCLMVTATSPATVILAGIFFVSFVTFCSTVGAFKKEET